MDLCDLASPGAVFELRVKPRARHAGLWRDAAGQLHVAVTSAPEKGRANEEVRRILAKALGVAPTRLLLECGSKSRVKRFRLA